MSDNVKEAFRPTVVSDIDNPVTIVMPHRTKAGWIVLSQGTSKVFLSPTEMYRLWCVLDDHVDVHALDSDDN